MALIQCNECGKEISDSAESCPHCGCKTNHGKSVEKVKAQGYMGLIAIIAFALGGYLLFSFASEYNSHSSYYWEYNMDEQYALIMKMAAGIGAIVGGFIILKLTKKIENNS